MLFLPPPGASAATLGGVALYSQGALVGGGEAAEDPLRLPSFARGLAAGVVDVSAGLTLTLDRERSAPTAASQATLRALRTSVLRALPGLLAPLADDGSDAAQAIWLAHGRAVLAGALPPSADADASEARASAALRQLCLFRSVSGGDAGAPRTLGAHAAAAVAAGQPALYFGAFESAAAAEESALCEFAEARGYDVVVGATPVEAEVLRAAAAAAAAAGGLPLVDVKSAGLPLQRREPPVVEETVDAPPADAATAAAEAAAAVEAATAAMSRVDAVVAQRQARRDARARRQAGALEIEVDAEVEEAEAEAEAAEAVDGGAGEFGGGAGAAVATA